MDYAKAKALTEKHAPDMDCEDAGMHVNVKLTEKPGRIHSITLPKSTEEVPIDDARQEELFVNALKIARDFL